MSRISAIRLHVETASQNRSVSAALKELLNALFEHKGTSNEAHSPDMISLGCNSATISSPVAIGSTISISTRSVPDTKARCRRELYFFFESVMYLTDDELIAPYRSTYRASFEFRVRSSNKFPIAGMVHKYSALLDSLPRISSSFATSPFASPRNAPAGMSHLARRVHRSSSRCTTNRSAIVYSVL